jgi:ribokinase
MTARVVVIGDLMVDVIAVPSGPLAVGSDRPSSVRTLGGGSAANTACWLASLGRPASLVAAVGDDPLGQVAVRGLTDAGVTFAGVVDPTCATGACVVLVDEHGERTMLPDRGANDALAPEAVDAAIEGAAWLHLSGYALLGEGSRPAGFRAIELARATGVRWSVDASSAAPLAAVGAEAFLAWVDGCDVLFANDDELAVLGGAAACTGVVVAKHGPDGASWFADGEESTTTAVVATVVDTVGAGDAFDAGVIDAVLRGLRPLDALAAGAAVAARAVSQAGARPRTS